MPGVSRATQDQAGGVIMQGSSNVFVNGKPAVIFGSTVAPHGNAPHSVAKMNQGSSTVFVNGKPLVRSGDRATCGHTASGSSDVFAG